jgi:hypothetical protein
MDSPPGVDQSKPAADAAKPNPLLFPPNKRPRTGKVAKLPDELRNSVSQQLYDEVPFAQIIRRLDEQGHPGFNTNNINSWKIGGYRDWLCLEEHRLPQEARQNQIVRTIRSKGSLDDAALSLALNQVFEVLDGFEITLLQNRLSEHPQMYPVVVHALLKLVRARSTFSAHALSHLPVTPSPHDPDYVIPDDERGLTEETLKKITDAIHLF